MELDKPMAPAHVPNPSTACRRWDADAAAVLLAARLARGWSREGVGRAVGCSRSAIWGGETGNRALSLPIARGLADLYRLTGAERSTVLAAARRGVGRDSPFGTRESRRTTVRADRRMRRLLDDLAAGLLEPMAP